MRTIILNYRGKTYIDKYYIGRRRAPGMPLPLESLLKKVCPLNMYLDYFLPSIDRSNVLNICIYIYIYIYIYICIYRERRDR